MSHIQWSNELSVGVKAIDDQHKELIRIANGLINAAHKGSGKRVVTNVIRRLREYTVFHFNSEEKLMEEARFPKRGDHIAEHARLKHDVKLFQRKLYEQKHVKPEVILEFLKTWLLKHILSTDRELARHIKENRTQTRTETSVVIGKR